MTKEEYKYKRKMQARKRRENPEVKAREHEASKRWRAKNKEKISYDNKNKYKVGKREYVDKNKERIYEKNKEAHKRDRTACLAHYGSACKCCGERRYEFLTLDHVNNDGAEHRKTVKNMYRWAIKNNFPPIFQILCWNCNCSKGRYGFCPHEKEKASTEQDIEL